MAAYELFAATTPDLAIANIKTKAEAYGWTIDFFGTYNSHNRLHLHNADGAHFELWWLSSLGFYIAACTGYSSGSAPTAQPGVSSSLQITGNYATLIVVCPSSIYLKIFKDGTLPQNIQFGMIEEKIGVWAGGVFISSTCPASNSYAFSLWSTYSLYSSQVLINGIWSTPVTSNGGAVYGVCESELYTKMPFAYSGGILPAPLMLVQINPSTTTYRIPLGYAPDVRMFSGGSVYSSLEEITIDGETWLAINQSETGGTFLGIPDTLIRLAA